MTKSRNNLLRDFVIIRFKFYVGCVRGGFSLYVVYNGFCLFCCSAIILRLVTVIKTSEGCSYAVCIKIHYVRFLYSAFREAVICPFKLYIYVFNIKVDFFNFKGKGISFYNLFNVSNLFPAVATVFIGGSVFSILQFFIFFY